MADYELRLCRPEEEDASWAVEKQVWNPFNWEAEGAVGVDYDPDLHIIAVGDDGELVGTIDACPMEWDGDPETLPEDGWTGVVLRAIEGFSERPDYACALGASVLPGLQQSGLSVELLGALREQAFSLGYRALLAPVRPTQRMRMPHISITRYAEARLADGRHFDPWIRTHERLGGRIVGSCEDSAVFGAPREEWERWCGLRLPGSGRVICPDTQGWLELDSDYGLLREGSVWLLHENPEHRVSSQ